MKKSFLLEKTYIVVANEHTLGYTKDATSPIVRVWVLGVDYMKGGDPSAIGNSRTFFRADTRLASLDDFEHFRVRPEGYETEGYVWNK